MAAAATRSAIHWALIRSRQEQLDAERDEDGHTENQACQCPYYVPLEGVWGMDWGAIMHPQSVKFGRLVFEHEWCGCGWHGPGGNQS